MDDFERAKPWLEAALPSTDGTYTIEDVQRYVSEKKQILITGQKCAMTFECVQYPRAKALLGLLCGGDLDEIKSFDPRLIEFGQALGCNRIYLSGRPGWERALRDLGYKRVSTIIGKDI